MVAARHVYHFVSLFTGTELPGQHSTKVLIACTHVYMGRDDPNTAGHTRALNRSVFLFMATEDTVK